MKGPVREEREEMGREMRKLGSSLRQGVWAEPAKAPQSQTQPATTSLNNVIL